MPFNISQETREVTKKIGKQSLTLTYLPHRYSASEEARFADRLNSSTRKCPQCSAKLPLEEVPESEHAAKRAKGQTNGHVVYERAVICSECGADVNPAQAQASIIAEWLSENLVEIDWEDAKGMIPVDKDSILERVPFELMNVAFTMIAEDKAGKK